MVCMSFSWVIGGVGWVHLLCLLLSLPDTPAAISDGPYVDNRDAYPDKLRFGRAASREPGNGGRVFAYLDYFSTKSALFELQREYPKLVRVFAAQDNPRWAATLPSPGNCGKAGPCKQYYAQITADADHPAWDNLKEAESDLDGDPVARHFAARPEVFFSGCLHGNERVGPTTTVEFARLLVENYVHGQNTWLRRLVDTRSIWIMPNANALGYYENVREERTPHTGLIDPNRDFPYGVTASQCMRTTAGRALNHLFREHLFQMAITFHGGMRSIAYEWGSPNHAKYSPDDGALRPIGKRMQLYASKSYYPSAYVAPMNLAVYGVKGGMEDWAYASSWDKTGYVKPCTPSTKSYPAYPKALTTYTSDMLRVFNILVETADRKTPEAKTLGGPHQILRQEGSRADGHVARNLRLALLMTDLVRPYAAWSDVDGHCGISSLQNWWDGTVRPEALKHAERGGFGGGSNTMPTPTYMMAWDVGGALEVDETHLFVWYERVDAATLGVDEDAHQPCAGKVLANDGGAVVGGADYGMNPEVVPADVVRVLSATAGGTAPGSAMRSAAGPPGPAVGLPGDKVVARGYRVERDSTLSRGGSIWGTGYQPTQGSKKDHQAGVSESALFPDNPKDMSKFGFYGNYKAAISLDSNVIAALLKAEAVGDQGSVAPSSFLRIVVVAGARVDSSWSQTTRPGVTPVNEPPISHVVKARTIAGYKASNNGVTIEGQTWWFSERRCMRLVVERNRGTAAAGSKSGNGSGAAAGSGSSASGKSSVPPGTTPENSTSSDLSKTVGSLSSASDSRSEPKHSGSVLEGNSNIISDENSTLVDGSMSADAYVTMLVLAAGVSFAVLCSVTVMHSQGFLEGAIFSDDKASRRANWTNRNRRVRRRSSQMNEFSQLKEPCSGSEDNDDYNPA